MVTWKMCLSNQTTEILSTRLLNSASKTYLATIDLKEACSNNKIQLLVFCCQKFKHITSYNVITANFGQQL